MAFRSNPRQKFMGPSPWLQGAPPSALLPNPMQAQGSLMNQGPRQSVGYNPIVSQLALANNLLTTALNKNQGGFGASGGRGLLGSAPQPFHSPGPGGPGMMRNMMMQSGPDPKRMRMTPGSQVIPPFNQRPRMPFNSTNRPQNRGNRDQPSPLFRERNQLKPILKRTRWEEEKNKKLKETASDKTDLKSKTDSTKEGEDIVVSSGDEKTYDPSSPTSDVEAKDNEEADNSHVSQEGESSDKKDEQGILQVTIQKGMKGRSVCKEGEAVEEWKNKHGNDDAGDESDDQGDDDQVSGTKAGSSENLIKTKQAESSQSPIDSPKKNVATLQSDNKFSMAAKADAEHMSDPSTIPPYNPDRAIGLSHVVPLSGLFCKLCRKFYKDEDSAERHCQSKQHYDNYKKSLAAAANFQKLKEKRDSENNQENETKDGKKTSTEDGKKTSTEDEKKTSTEEEKKKSTEDEKPSNETSEESASKDIPSNKEAANTDDEMEVSTNEANATKDDADPPESQNKNEELSGDQNVKSASTDQSSEPTKSASPEKDKKESAPSADVANTVKSKNVVKKTPQRGRGRGKK